MGKKRDEWGKEDIRVTTVKDKHDFSSTFLIFDSFFSKFCPLAA